MELPQGREGTLSAAEAARAAGVSKNTLLRWLRQGKVPDVARDRNGWRIFSRRDIETINAFAWKTTPPAARRNTSAALRGPAAGGAGGAGEARTREAA